MFFIALFHSLGMICVTWRRGLYFFPALIHSQKEALAGARCTGIGGVFLTRHLPPLAAWYAQHLGIALTECGGASFLWSDEVPAGTGQTTWMLFPDASKHLGVDPAQRAMINYRVDDLEGILAQLSAAGPIDHKQESASYGKFAWFTDP